MIPDRWRQVDDLFDAARGIEPGGRDSWLRKASEGDESLRAQVVRLLEQDAKATQDGFLSPPERANLPADETASWVSPARRGAPEIDPHGDHGLLTIRDGGFVPRSAIRKGTSSHPSSGSRSLGQHRLRELTIIFLLISGLMIFWKYVVLRDPVWSQAIPYAVMVVALAMEVVMLSLPRTLSPSLIKVLEVGTIGMVAGVFAVGQYQTMLDFSIRDDLVRAQLVMKNRVLITAVLILSYGIYAPRSWRHSALVVGPLAVLPFATLLVLYLKHPQTMSWLSRMGLEHDTTPVALLGFDVIILLVLAVGAASGANTISRLRWQVAEARHLGQYRLRRRLGAGGMGEVYLAEHELLKRPCALKLIRPGIETGPTALARFEREVRLTATLSHPNTVEIYDYGRTEDGTYYYVMEYLPGLSLTELVEQHGPLPPGRAVYLLRQVCHALREAHAAGLIHRDIKPSNIFASRRGGMDDVAKLFDFGLVLPVSKDGAPHMSGEGRILGTPQFMSPEQATGHHDLDGRSDIYSLGAVAYYLLTGHPPFDDHDGIALLIAHARDPVVPPSQLRAGIPDDLERVIMRCLAKDTAARYPDAEALERALGECACIDDWDQGQAMRWWRDQEQEAPVA